jgi:hypothetical protein
MKNQCGDGVAYPLDSTRNVGFDRFRLHELNVRRPPARRVRPGPHPPRFSLTH